MYDVKRKLLLIVIVALLSIQTISSASEPAQSFGHVNISMAVVLHPLMAQFEPSTGRFSVAVSGKVGGKFETPEVKENELKKRRTLLQEEREVLEASVKEIEKEYSEFLGALEKPGESGITDPSQDSKTALNEYYKIRQSREKDFRKRLIAVRHSIKRKDQEIESIDKNYAILNSTTGEETARVFKIILDEIIEATNEVAKHYKIPFVFNSSFSGARRNIVESLSLANPMKEFIEEEISFTSEESEPILLQSIYIWALNTDVISAWNADPRMNRFIITGGVDMTSAVVDLIYQKYKISQRKRDIIQSHFRNYAKQQPIK